MMNKIFGVKNITHLLYGFLICMPMLSILARTCYVAINKNAKDSYSDFEVSEKQYEVLTDYDMVVGNTYLFISNNLNSSQIHTGNIICSNVNVISSSRDFSSVDLSTITGFNLYTYNNNTILRFISSPSINDLALNTNYINFEFTFLSFNNINTSNDFSYYFDSMIYHNTIISNSNTLDNAFEYSLSQFTKDNNLGNVDLFSWFTNLFLDQTNPTNQLYLGFVNWYLNYTLLVSSGYLLFLTLIWFVNYVRRILDKSMNQEYGGF